ncbi:MAG: hypothetical protein COB65_11640, partial [Thalassobium sp.]
MSSARRVWSVLPQLEHLPFAGQGLVLLAADLDLEHAGEKTSTLDLLRQVPGVDGNQDRVF